MRYTDKYGDKTSTADKPCAVTAEAMKAYPPDVEQVLEGCDFANLRELAAAYREAWNALACDKWLLNKRTAVFCYPFINSGEIHKSQISVTVANVQFILCKSDDTCF
jgi:hypothetical protein